MLILTFCNLGRNLYFFLQIRRRRLARLDGRSAATSKTPQAGIDLASEPCGSSVKPDNADSKEMVQERIPEAPKPQEADSVLEKPRLSGMETGIQT